MATTTTPANALEGDQELAIRIFDIKAADALAQQVLKLREQAAKITSIHIDTTPYFRALEEAEDLAYVAEKKLGILNNSENTTISQPPDPVAIAASLCTPVTTILSAIASHAGSLKSFTWPASSHTHCNFTRPPAFWSALYAHASTLEKLHLDFFCHEVQTFPLLPPDVKLERLKVLQIDASSAHGDDGSVIDDLLARCENVEVLHFEWPPCDLGSCQIENISWRWKFTKLTNLSVFGWNLAPAAYTDFLVRHPGIQSLEERVDGPYDSGQRYADIQLPVMALPNLQKLSKGYTNTHPLATYFNAAANRPIRSLTLYVDSSPGVEQGLLDMTKSEIAQTKLQALELTSDIKCWRDESADESSSDDEDETAQERQQRKADEERERKARLPTRLPNILRTVLSSFSSLRRLLIDMDSSNATFDVSSGAHVFLDPMNGSDLRHVLACLPSDPDYKLILLRMRDSRAQALDEVVEKGLHTGEIAVGGLQHILWEGEQKYLYSTPAFRRAAVEAEMNWSEGSGGWM